MPIELQLSRSNRVYRFGELVEGKVLTVLTSPVSYQKIIISLTGTVNLQVRGGVTGVIESLYNVVKPISIMKKSIELAASPGKLGPDRTELHFSFFLSSEEESSYMTFYETFHGGSINIQYLISAVVRRGYLHKPLSTTLELIVEHNKDNLNQALLSPEIVSFLITKDTQKHKLHPELSSGQFRVTGNILTQCSLSKSLCGELVVEESTLSIRSIDILLLRVESILAGERIISDTSIIQTTQMRNFLSIKFHIFHIDFMNGLYGASVVGSCIFSNFPIADGNVCRSMTLPIYVVLPRLLICPTVLSGPFSIEFQVSIVVSFQTELSKPHSKFDLQIPSPWLALLNLPLTVFRTS